MTWDDIRKGLSKVAPMIGTAIGGPFGALAGTVVGSVLGMSSEDSQDETKVAEAVQMAMGDPERILKLKEAEQSFKTKMRDLDIKEEDLHAKDRDSARKMQIATNSYIPGILAILVTIGFFGLLGYMCWFEVPEGNKGALNIMLGSLGTAWVTVMTFYFGSSKSSHDKTRIMGDK